MASFLVVRHNIEVAHRLSLTPGQCENIHGHSMWVELALGGSIDDTGKIDGLDFAKIKQYFREYLDKWFDHRLLLASIDPLLAGPNTVAAYPGLQLTQGDPTTENIAKWIGEWARHEFNKPTKVTVHETSVNAAVVEG